MKNRMKNQRGSMLIGVLIIFLMVAAISLAVIMRTSSGSIMVSRSQQGYSAYQASDSSTESLLTRVKKLDDDISGNSIPENTLASGYCSSGSCFDANGHWDSPSSKKVSDIMAYSEGASSGDTQRNVYAPLPGRVSVPIKDLKAEKCGSGSGGCTYNRCDAKVSWAWNGSSEDLGKSKAYEVRRSTQSSLDSSVTGYGWRVPDPGNPTVNIGTNYNIVKNGDNYVSNQYGKSYYFSLKILNSQNFDMDSLYYQDPVKLDLEGSAQCADGNGTNIDDMSGNVNGCVTSTQAATHPGIVITTASNNCCNGTECYKPDANWREADDKKCAVQTCYDSLDNPPLYASGWSDVGWCGTRNDCAVSTNCTLPYRTLGYCATVPSADSQYTSFLPASAWTFSNYVKLYQGPGGPSTTGPRCTKHTCPSYAVNGCGSVTGGVGSFSASLSSCSVGNCGFYSAGVSCSLSCPSGYYATGYRSSISSGQVNVNYSNNCCYQSQPHAAYSCTSVGYECGSTQVWDPACGGGSWSNRYCYNKTPCPSFSCGSNCSVLGSCTPMCGYASDGRYCSGPISKCGPAPSCPCGYSGSCYADCNGVHDSRRCNSFPICPPPPSCPPGSHLEGSCYCTCSGCTSTGHCVKNPPPPPPPPRRR